jgi:hypothetical protein
MQVKINLIHIAVINGNRFPPRAACLGEVTRFKIDRLTCLQFDYETVQEITTRVIFFKHAFGLCLH